MVDGGQLQHQRHQAHKSHGRTKLAVLRVLGITLLTIVALHILIVILPYFGFVVIWDLPPALETVTGILWLLTIGFGLPLALFLTIGVCVSLAWSWPHVTLAERMAWGLIAGLGLGLALLLLSPLGWHMTYYT